jgi:hypothetical protein
MDVRLDTHTIHAPVFRNSTFGPHLPTFVLETLLETAFLFSYSCGRGAVDLHHSRHFETLDVSSILAQVARLMYP